MEHNLEIDLSIGNIKWDKKMIKKSDVQETLHLRITRLI